MLCYLTPNPHPSIGYFRMFGELLMEDGLALFEGFRHEYNAQGNHAEPTRITLRLRLRKAENIHLVKNELTMWGRMDCPDEEVMKAFAQQSFSILDETAPCTVHSEWNVSWLVGETQRPAFLRGKTQHLWRGLRVSTFPFRSEALMDKLRALMASKEGG